MEVIYESDLICTERGVLSSMLVEEIPSPLIRKCLLPDHAFGYIVIILSLGVGWDRKASMHEIRAFPVHTVIR